MIIILLFAAATTLTLRGSSYVSYRVYDWRDRVHSSENRISLFFMVSIRLIHLRMIFRPWPPIWILECLKTIRLCYGYGGFS